MKVILLQDIKSLGKAGDLKEVSDGYARNLLLPKGLVEIATDGAMKKNAALKIKQSQLAQSALMQTKKISEQLQNKEFTLRVKAKDGKLFGSIAAKQIAVELSKANFLISEDAIALPKPLKEVGNYDVKIQLGHNINAKIKIILVGEK